MKRLALVVLGVLAVSSAVAAFRAPLLFGPGNSEATTAQAAGRADSAVAHVFPPVSLTES